MPVKLPTNAPKSAADKPTENKFDPFRPEMPKIPGVSLSSLPTKRATGGPDSQRLLQIGGIAIAALFLVAAIYWWATTKSKGGTAPDADLTDQTTSTAQFPVPRSQVHDGPSEAATLEELSKPWAAKKFTFVRPVTHQNIDAMVIRLPGGDLWAFALQGPADHCELAFVADLDALASQYGFNASHPMVVSPCDRTVYDPLKVGALGGNTWVRGEIVKGSGLRPPISIDVKPRGRSIIADSIE
jgi:hypothetical protein